MIALSRYSCPFQNAAKGFWNATGAALGVPQPTCPVRTWMVCSLIKTFPGGIRLKSRKPLWTQLSGQLSRSRARFSTWLSQKNYFINPCCFGDDLAKWLIGELRKDGLRTDEEPGQEDFGWYLNFEVLGASHIFIIGHRPSGESEVGTWIGWLERNRGFIASIFGRRKHEIASSAAVAIHTILSRSPQIQDVRWHFQRDFDKGNEVRGVSSP
jgi:hypothetical protein